MRKIEVLIIDDHSLFRQTLSFMMNKGSCFRVTGESNDVEMGFSLAQQKRPDIILIDINIPPAGGFKLIEKILTHSAHFKIIAISMQVMAGYIRRVLQAGAMGYVTKNSGIEELFACITEVYNGRKHVCQQIRDILVKNELDCMTTGMIGLSNRELDIAGLIKEGLSSKDIALLLDITTRTVEAHRYNILKKLNLKNTAALVNYTNFNGL